MTIKPKQLAELKPAPTPMQLLDLAVSTGANVETLERLMALQERWEKNEAKKAFDNAMADAKAAIQPIIKNRQVDFTSQRGRTNYSYEDLAEIAKEIDPILAKHGLSYRYRTSNDERAVTVTCIVSHRDGHSEENSLSAGYDVSGNKNNIQAIGSTVTYLQRYTLKPAFGLSASIDDDGQAAGRDGRKKAKVITSDNKPNIEIPPNERNGQNPEPAESAASHATQTPGEAAVTLSQPAQMYAGQLSEAAKKGTPELQKLWKVLHPRYQAELKDHLEKVLKPAALIVDKKDGLI